MDTLEENAKAFPKALIAKAINQQSHGPKITAKAIRPSSLKISNLELWTALLALVHQSAPYQQKKHRGIKEPDTFSGESSEELWVFIFQCQIYFWACEGEFSEDTEKIFFIISYLRDIALDYFELFINEPNPTKYLDFLEE